MPRKASITSLAEKKAPKLGVEAKLAQWTANRSTMGVDWTKVPALTLRTVFALCISEGVYIAFSAVQGGLGVCVTVYVGEEKKKVYANNAEDLCFLLDQLIDLLSPSSLDVRAVYAAGND